MSRATQRPATISDVADAAGVSRSAVSKVLRNAYGVSPAMRERVSTAMDELKYVPRAAARALRGSSFRIGLEVPHLGGQFATQVVDGAQAVLRGTPYRLALAPADGADYGAIESLADGLVDGIIAVSPLVDSVWLDQIAQATPVVMLGRHDHPQHYDVVVGDDETGARLIMDHLFGLGHRRIAHLTESSAVTKPNSGTPHAIRLQVYLDCMAAAGLDTAGLVARREAPYSVRTGTATLLNHEQAPTAIFAGHDDIAIEVLAELTALGRLDVAVVGYDNIALACHPLISLTSIDQGGAEMGAQATTMLLERINGRTEPRRHSSTPILNVRQSTIGRSVLETAS